MTMKNERCLIKKIFIFNSKIVKICMYLISLTFIMGFYYDNGIHNDLEEITVELGEHISIDKLNYAKNLFSDTHYVIENSVITDEYGYTSKIGTYNYYIVYIDEERMLSKTTSQSGIINVVDTTKPDIILKKDNFSFSYKAKINVNDIALCIDKSSCNLKFLNKVNNKKVGKQNITIEATDDSGNTNQINVDITIKKPKVIHYSNNSFNNLNTKNENLNKSLSDIEKNILRNEIINYAKLFVGNPYVYGGNSLTKGTDCSGFTKLIYAHFGYTLPRVAKDQAYIGKKISKSELTAGDIIVYHYSNGGGHVGIYIGNGKMIHAGTSKTGITIANVFSGNKTYHRIIY